MEGGTAQPQDAGGSEHDKAPGKARRPLEAHNRGAPKRTHPTSFYFLFRLLLLLYSRFSRLFSYDPILLLSIVEFF